MALFLQIVGGFIVAILLIVIAVYLYFRIKFGKYLHANNQQTPLHIHLNEDVSPDWLNKSNVKKVSKALIDAGFTPGKSYFIHEMEGYLLQVFFKGPVAAVMYWQDIAGCWVDMVAEEVDGKEYTFSNAPMGGEMSERPECEKHFDAQASVADLYLLVDGVVAADKEYLQVNKDNFRLYFEEAFKKDIAWKTRNGGISYEEFKAIEKNASFSVSSAVADEAYIETKENELYQWHDAALEEYKVKMGLKDDDFYDLAEKLVIVPFSTNATAFIRYLSSYSFVNDKQEEKLTKVFAEEENIDALFNKMNDLLSPDLRASFVTDVDYPLPIKVYQLCDKMLDY